MDYIDRIADLGACPEAIAWLREAAHPDLAAAWTACPRAEWLLWLAARCVAPGSAEHRAVVAAAADCAAEVLDLVPPGEDRPRRAAVETARRWARGEATAAECRAAARAAAAAADDDDAAWAAAYAAADAADAARAARAAAWAATYAADAAAVAGRSVDLAAIVRRHLPAPPTLSE